MEAKLRGRPAAGLPPEHRAYRLAKTFGWTLTEIDEQPAVGLDWLLAIDDAYQKVEGERT